MLCRSLRRSVWTAAVPILGLVLAGCVPAAPLTAPEAPAQEAAAPDEQPAQEEAAPSAESAAESALETVLSPLDPPEKVKVAYVPIMKFAAL